MRDSSFGKRNCARRWNRQTDGARRRQRRLINRAAMAAALPVGAAAAMLAAPVAQAQQTQYWAADGLNGGGSGQWDLSNARWTTNLASLNFTTWDNNAGDSAVFGGPGGAVQLNDAVAVSSLTFNADYTLVNVTGVNLNPLVLTGSGVIDTGSNRVTIFPIISGTSGLTKMGSGVLFFHGNNNFSGPLNVNAGTLALDNTQFANIPDSAPVFVAAGARLDFGALNGSSYNDSMGTISGSGRITLGTISGLGVNTGSQIVFGGTPNAEWDGQISGQGGRLVKGGSGTWLLGGTNTFGGLFTVQLGTVRLTSTTALMGGSNTLFVNGANTLFDMSGTSPTIGSLNGGGTGTTVALGNGNLTLGTDNLWSTYNGAVSGGGRVIKVGSGVQVFANVASSYAGGVTVKDGIFVASADSRLGAIPGSAQAGYISLDGGTLANFTGAPYTINANRGIDITANNGGLMAVANMTYNGVITGVGQLTKSGANLLTLGASNLYTGGTVINDGTVNATIGAGTPLGTGPVQIRTGALTLQPVNGSAAVVLSVAGGVGSTFTYGPGSVLGLNANGNTSLTLNIGGVAVPPAVNRAPGGSLVVVPTDGVAQLGGIVKVLVAGGMPVQNGIVSPSIISQNSATNTTGEFLTYDPINGLMKATYSPLTDINTADNTTVFEATGPQTLSADAHVYSLVARSQNISGAFVLNVGNGSGEAGVILNGNSSINTAALAFGGADAIIHVGGGTGAAINAPITGSGGLTKTGADTLTLGGNSTYGGPTTIGTGAVSIGITDALPTNTALALGPSAVLQLNGRAQTVGALSTDNVSAKVDLGADGVLTVAGSNSTRFLGAIVGSGASTLVQDGPGTLTLGQPLAIGAIPSAANSFNKLVIRNGGIVSIGTAASFGTNAVTSPLPDAFTLDGGTLRDTSLNVAGLSGGGASFLAINTNRGVVLTGAGGTFDVTQPQEIFIMNGLGNVFSGTGSLTKTGPGFFRLLGGNTYTGKTIILEGNMQFPADNALGQAPADFVPDQLTLNGGMIQPNAGFNIAPTRGVYIGTAGGTFNLGASLGVNSVISGPGALTVVAANTLTLNPGSGTSVNTFNGLILTNGRTDFYVSGAAGTGTITVDPKFPVTLQKTALVADTVLDNPVTLGPGSAIFFRADPNIGKLVFNGKISGPNDIYRGSGGVTNTAGTAGQGTVVFGNSGNDYTGLTVLTTGTLVAAANNALGATSAGTVVNPNTTLGFQGGINYTAPEPVSLAGTINNVSGTNLFAGPIDLTQDAAVTVPADSLQLSGAIGGAPGFTFSGAGTLILSGSNTFGGVLNISSPDAGTLSVGSDSNLGGPTATINLNSGTLLANATFATPRAINITSSSTALDALGGANVTYQGGLSISGDLNKGSNAGTVTIPVSVAGLTVPNINANGGTLQLGDATGMQGPLVVSNTLAINNDATVKLARTGAFPAGHFNHTVQTLSIGTNGLLDLGNHKLYVDNTATPEATVQQYLHNGYNADPNTGIGNWLGRGGITSSDAIASHNGANPDFRISVGYVNGAYATDPLINGSIPGQESLPTSQILIRPALYGDLNLDGKVDDTDLAILSGLGQYNQPTDRFGWLGGDLNQDGKVDDVDLQILSGAGNYNGPTYGAASGGASHASATPSATPSLTGHVEANGDIILSASTSQGVPGDGVLDFEYDPATGHLFLRYDGDPRVTAAQPFQVVRFKSAGGHFIPGNFNQTDFGAGVTATTTALNGTASGSNSVPDGYDMGAVLPTGLTAADLTSDLTLQWNVFGGGLTLKNGDVVVPEPAALGLVGLGAVGLLRRRRRRSSPG